MAEPVASANPAFGTARSLAPAAVAAIERLEAQAISSADEATLHLCRLRIRQLFGVAIKASTEQEQKLALWPSSPLFDDVERACLAFTEQFVIDVSGITETETAPLLQHLGPAGLYRFTFALYAIDQIERLRLTLEATIGPTPA
jgi:alkylhydroperoxidase family enzyme